VLQCLGHILSAQSSLPLEPLPERDRDEIYAVYSALIKITFGTRDSSTLLIIDHTNEGRVKCLRSPDGEESWQYKEQLDDFVQSNKLLYRLAAKFDVDRPYDLVETRPVRASGRIPRYASLSGAGFDAARKRAVVYMEDGLMGGVRFLTKVQGKWTVDTQRMPFVCGWIT